MSVSRTSLWRLGALVLVSVAFAAPAKAEMVKGLSLRVGYWHPVTAATQSLTDWGAGGVGLEYQTPFIPKLFNGDGWSSSISVDFHYSERKTGIVRYIPVSINQIYTFEEQNGRTPYAGFCVTAATVGASLPNGKIPTATRFGAGLILGLNWNSKMYVETRYEVVDTHGGRPSVEGLRTYLGYRF